MRIPVSLSLALRSFLHRRREYASLLLVCLFGVGVSLFSLSVSRGMISSLADKARIYYGGDYVVMGGTGEPSIDGAEEMAGRVEEAFRSAGIDAKASVRLDFDAKQAAYYFEGAEARQRVIKGVDFTRERGLLGRLTFVDGGLPEGDGAFAVLSRPAARTLGCSAGDEITLLLVDVSGYINTVRLTVAGVYRDSSVFGMYTSYVGRSALTEACGRPSSWANRVCVDTGAEGTDEASSSAALAALSGAGLAMFPPVRDKRVFYDALARGFPEPTFALVPLSANMTEVRVMEVAMKALSLFVISMLVVIIVAGIGSTWRVVVMKRLGELGIYRSVGMQRRTLLAALLWEAALLVSAGCAGGVALALSGQRLIRLADFTFIPSFDIFLTDGVVEPITDWAGGAVVIALVASATLAVVFRSVRRTVAMPPAEALASGDAS